MLILKFETKCPGGKDLDQGIKAVNPKLRPRWKEPYLVIDLFNEVNAILKADCRSRRTKIVHPSQSEESTSEEEIKSDKDPGKSTDEASILLSSASSEWSDVEYLKSSPDKRRIL